MTTFRALQNQRLQAEHEICDPLTRANFGQTNQSVSPLAGIQEKALVIALWNSCGHSFHRERLHHEGRLNPGVVQLLRFSQLRSSAKSASDPDQRYSVIDGRRLPTDIQVEHTPLLLSGGVWTYKPVGTARGLTYTR